MDSVAVQQYEPLDDVFDEVELEAAINALLEQDQNQDLDLEVQEVGEQAYTPLSNEELNQIFEEHSIEGLAGNTPVSYEEFSQVMSEIDVPTSVPVEVPKKRKRVQEPLGRVVARKLTAGQLGGKFLLNTFVEKHCDTINKMAKIKPQGVAAINIATTMDADDVLAVVREYMLGITDDMGKAARVIMGLMNSSENPFIQPKPRSRHVHFQQTQKSLLFYKAEIKRALRERNIVNANQLEAYWREQMVGESEERLFSVILGVIYMYYLTNELKTSRQRGLPGDQQLAHTSLLNFITHHIPTICA